MKTDRKGSDRNDVKTIKNYPIVSWTVFGLLLFTSFVLCPILTLILMIVCWPIQFINYQWWICVKQYVAYIGCYQFAVCTRMAGLRVRVSGDDISKLQDDKCLVLINHLALFDHFLFISTVIRFGTNIVGRWMFCIYNLWKTTPLGLVWHWYGNLFINAVPANQRKKQEMEMRQHFESVYLKDDKKWICLYPEGSRLFLIKESNKRYEKRNGLEPMSNCAYPRIGATHCAITSVGPSIKDINKTSVGNGTPLKYIIDVTLGYPNGKIESLDKIVTDSLNSLKPKEYTVHFEVIPLDVKLNDEQQLQKFMFDRYRKKDKLLEKYYKTGKFTDNDRLLEEESMYKMSMFLAAQFVILYLTIKLLVFVFLR